MSLSLAVPADGLKATLTPHGVPVGNIQYVSARSPTPPYQGPVPAVFIRVIPAQAQVVWEGAGCARLDGQLEVTYLDHSSEQQERDIGAIETDMAANLDAIIAAVLADVHLGGAVGDIILPITCEVDPEGPFREWLSAMWVFAQLTVPFMGTVTGY